MRRLMQNGISLLILLEIETMTSQAQSLSSRYEIGIHAGTFLYQGDLTPASQGSLKTLHPSLTLTGSRFLSPSLALRGTLTFSRLSGDDALYDQPTWRKQRNFNFQTPVFEFTAQAVWDPTAQNFSTQRTRFAPYVFAGAGLSFLRINRDYSAFNAGYFENEPEIAEGLTTDMARNPPRVLPVFPVGAGLRFNLNNRISFHAESNYRLSFTDYLDGFSQAANPSKRDYYHSQSLGVVYRFGKRPSWKCPKF